MIESSLGLTTLLSVPHLYFAFHQTPDAPTAFSASLDDPDTLIFRYW
jgi:hypothetical protein